MFKLFLCIVGQSSNRQLVGAVDEPKQRRFCAGSQSFRSCYFPPVGRILATEICFCIVIRKPCIVITYRNVWRILAGRRTVGSLPASLVAVLVFFFQFTIQIGFYNTAFPFAAYVLIKRGNVLAKHQEAEQENAKDTKLPKDWNGTLRIGFFKFIAAYIDDSQ